MLRRIARSWAGEGHRLLLVIWRYLPLAARRFAIRLLYPRFPIGAVAIVRDADGRVLLVRQTYHRAGARWGAPGGWLAHRETPRQAAARETFEETGLRVSVGRVLEIGTGPYREVSIAFECRIVGDTGFRPSDETDRMGYFATAELPPMTAATRALLERALAAQAGLEAENGTFARPERATATPESTHAIPGGTQGAPESAHAIPERAQAATDDAHGDVDRARS
jgi:ADP-ribose pyrophosphatase YjhB (NUDIX family)